MLKTCASIPRVLHTLRCSMAAVSCTYALLSHCLVACCPVVLPLLLSVCVSVCLHCLIARLRLLPYLLLRTVGARRVVPDRSRLRWGSLLRYHEKFNPVVSPLWLQHSSQLIYVRLKACVGPKCCDGACW